MGRARVGFWGLRPALSLVAIGLLTLGSACKEAKTGKPRTAVVDNPFPLDLADKIYDTRSMLTLKVQMKPQDWTRLSKQQPKNPCRPDPDFKYSYFDASMSINGHAIANVSIRKKSTCGSLSEHRPALVIKKKKGAGGKYLFGLKKGHDNARIRRLVLSNNAQDPSRIRQCLAYQMFRDAGLVAPRCQLVWLHVNGTSYGVYTSVEHIRKHFLEREMKMDLDDKSQWVLYKGDNHLHKADRSDSGRSRFEAKFSQLQNFNHQDGAYEIHKDQGFQALLKLNTSRQLPKDIAPYIRYYDLEQNYTYWAMEYLVGHWDGLISNTSNYLWFFHKSQGSIRYMPWGTDQVLRPGVDEMFYVNNATLLSWLTLRSPELRVRFRQVALQTLLMAWNKDKYLSLLDDLEKLVNSAEPNASAFFVREQINKIDVHKKLKRLFQMMESRGRGEGQLRAPRAVDGAPRAP